MPAIPHAFRRGGTYTWRRRLPRALAEFTNAAELVVGLGTADPRRARFLAAQLTALSDALFLDAMNQLPEPDTVLTSRQLDGLFREALPAHLAKLDRIAAAERAGPGFDPVDSARADRRMGWVFRLLAGRGGAAARDEATAIRMREDGPAQADLIEVGATLSELQRQSGHTIPRARLTDSLAAQGAAPTPVNLELARETTFRAMAEAAFATERRYDASRPDDARRVAAIMMAEAEQVGVPPIVARAEDHAQAPGADASRGPPVPSPPGDRIEHETLAAEAPRSTLPVPLAEHPVLIAAEALIAERARDETWDGKTQRQARQTFCLFAKVLIEAGVFGVEAIRQSHLAALKTLLFAVAPSYGNSPRDATRTLDELRAIGAALP